jgi:hypothetical protein
MRMHSAFHLHPRKHIAGWSHYAAMLHRSMKNEFRQLIFPISFETKTNKAKVMPSITGVHAGQTSVQKSGSRLCKRVYALRALSDVPEVSAALLVISRKLISSDLLSLLQTFPIRYTCKHTLGLTSSYRP